MASITHERLDEIRKQRGRGRPKLAKLPAHSESQLSRLEGALPMKGALSTEMLAKLFYAMGGAPGGVSGRGAADGRGFRF